MTARLLEGKPLARQIEDEVKEGVRLLKARGIIPCLNVILVGDDPASSTYVGPIQTGIVMATDRDGVANVVYVAGTALRTVIVGVRPYGIDAANGFYRTVEIAQQ